MRLSEATLVATPSIQRSAWLAGRAQLNFLPHTIFNTSYIPAKRDDSNLVSIYESIIPDSFKGKKILLYTGNVNASLCMLEFVEGFCKVEEDCRLIITGIKDNDYCRQIIDKINVSGKSSKVLLLPFVPREHLIALQSNAHIGVLFFKEDPSQVVTRIIAPNKAGEYLYNGLLLLGNDVFYLHQFQSDGVAVLAKDISPEEIATAICVSLNRLDNTGNLAFKYVSDVFNMKVQVAPITNILKATGANK